MGFEFRGAPAIERKSRVYTSKRRLHSEAIKLDRSQCRLQLSARFIDEGAPPKNLRGVECLAEAKLPSEDPDAFWREDGDWNIPRASSTEQRRTKFKEASLPSVSPRRSFAPSSRLRAWVTSVLGRVPTQLGVLTEFRSGRRKRSSSNPLGSFSMGSRFALFSLVSLLLCACCFLHRRYGTLDPHRQLVDRTKSAKEHRKSAPNFLRSRRP